MTSATTRSAQQLLDQAHTVAQIEAFSVESFADQLRDELPPAGSLDALATRDDALRATLAAIDAFAGKAMRVRLEHIPAADAALGTPFKKVIATTITGYAGDLELLRERVAATAARLDPSGAATMADAVVAAAREVLDQRAHLRAAVLALARDRATAALPDVRRAAVDRATDDAIRLRWSAARRDLEAIVEQPERLTQARFADRIAALPPLLDEADRGPEPTFADMIELD